MHHDAVSSMHGSQVVCVIDVWRVESCCRILHRSGPIPTEVSKMENLKWLDLRQNRLTGKFRCGLYGLAATPLVTVLARIQRLQ